MSVADMADIVEQWRSSLFIPGKPNEWESKQLLGAMGIAVPRGAFIAAGGSPIAAEDLSVLGTPGHRVVKACSGEILHKTEQEGVRVIFGF